MSTFLSGLNQVLSFVAYYILRALGTFIVWFFTLFSPMAKIAFGYITTIFAVGPLASGWTWPSWFADAGAGLGMANQWLPIDFGVSCFAVWCAVQGALIVYRVVKSYIPMMSG